MKQLLRLIGRLGKRPDAMPHTPEADHLAADHQLIAADVPPAGAPGAPAVTRD